MLSRLVTLAIILAIAYFLLTKAGPLLQQQFGGRAASVETDTSNEEGLCVDRAFSANDMLTRVARQYGQPPVDVDAWSDAQWQIDSEIQTAESACFCSAEACRAASDALAEMRDLVSNLDAMVHGTSAGFANPANQQERIYALLNQARSAAGY
jgi:hypothetical protein